MLLKSLYLDDPYYILKNEDCSIKANVQQSLLLSNTPFIYLIARGFYLHNTPGIFMKLHLERLYEAYLQLLCKHIPGCFASYPEAL